MKVADYVPTPVWPRAVDPVLPDSVCVLKECIELQLRKSRDYQNPNSSIVQADYYPSGIKTLMEIVHAKMLRAKSVIEAMEKDPTYQQNFESLEDSFKDAINYLSFAVAYLHGNVPGQSITRDFLNRPRKGIEMGTPKNVEVKYE